MKRLVFALLFFLACSMAVGAQEKPFTVPAVENWKAGRGELLWQQLTDITYSDASLQGQAEYLAGFLGEIPVRQGKGGSVALLLCRERKLGSEGYQLVVAKKGVTVKAQTPQGILWGIMTLQQLHEQGLPLTCGTITDTPAYPLRGMMIDVGRKFVPLSYLYGLVDLLSYYKMNTLHVHLNDNGSNDYFNNDWDETYAAFRMESDLFPELTAQDGYYTKRGFHDLIIYARSMGVEIIPEIDAPAHSLAFTHYRPSLACEEFGDNHLDLRNPAVVPFLDSLYSEYLGGQDPVFCCPRMHIGTDEYSNKDSTVVELFRSLADHLIREVESYGKQAVLWGSLTHCKGATPVKADNVVMDMWYNGYANPADMKALGYQMVCIPSRFVYIVPEAGYYYNYLNSKFLYEQWTPAKIADYTLDERDPQLLGGMFAVWNDICTNGISTGDIHHRIFPAVQVIAEKTWRAVNDTVGYKRWDEQRKALGEGYTCNQLGTTETELATLPAGTVINARDDAQIGYDYQVDFDITWAAETEGTVLLQGPYARFFLADPIGGWMGFTRDGYLYTFRHKGRPGRTEHITITGTNKSTALYVDGKLVQELGIEKRYYTENKAYNYVSTLVFPLHETGDFRSRITHFKATKQ
ncbi:MAG: family 20 glycosylhydrolase [Bacteroidaceae bacterium]|nr:family 20 glycosylhydrolase [Bacteroidaceae bacterium]